MKILSVNAGSSSLKFSFIEMPEKRIIVSGNFEKIGLNDSFYTIKYKEEKIKKDKKIDNHKDAVLILLEELKQLNIITNYEEIEGIGHRVVHGGDKFIDSVIINDEVINTIEELSDLSPLHNPANLLGIKSFMEVLPNVSNIAVFDTAFHQTLEKEYFLYPIPFEWYTQYGIRKYGFHGTSHKYVSKTISNHLGYNPKIVSCHIGNGASICAIKDGESIDTSMGLTPLEGVMMGTRSGNIDPGIIPYIMKKTNKNINEVIDDLNKKSGLLAISGVSNDLRDVEESMLKKEERSILAINMYIRRIVNYISIYNTLLNGMEVLLFTAGGGEKSDIIREKVCEELKCLSVEIDKNKNTGLRSEFKEISSVSSKVKIFVVPTDEEIMIADDTYRIIGEA